MDINVLFYFYWKKSFQQLQRRTQNNFNKIACLTLRKHYIFASFYFYKLLNIKTSLSSTIKIHIVTQSFHCKSKKKTFPFSSLATFRYNLSLNPTQNILPKNKNFTYWIIIFLWLFVEWWVIELESG